MVDKDIYLLRTKTNIILFVENFLSVHLL